MEWEFRWGCGWEFKWGCRCGCVGVGVVVGVGVLPDSVLPDTVCIERRVDCSWEGGGE